MQGVRFVLCGVAVMGMCAPVRAQTVEDLGGCDEVAAFVAAGRQDTATVRASRYYLIGHCPLHRTSALSSAILATRNGTLERNFGDLFSTAKGYRHADIAAAARQVANDATADTRARGYAIALLLQYILFDSWPSLDEMGSGRDDSGQLRTYCSIAPGSSHPPVQHGDALDDELQNAILLDLARIASDASAPLFVRNVAACWDGPGIQ